MILAASILLALVACLFAALLLRETLRNTGFIYKAAFLAVSVVFAVALMRPHEDIMGGDDHGAYLNSASAYLHNDSFNIDDELLGMVDSEARKDFFYYGHGEGIQTLFHALRIRGQTASAKGPWFQVGFPVLLAAAIALGGTGAALYVTPVIALMTGIAMASLGRLFVGDRRSGALALILYLSSPIVFWHGRYVRAEIPAAFFVIAGLFFFLQSINRESRRAISLFISAVAFGLSVFMHATAFMAIIPVLACAFWKLALGQRRYAGFILALAVFVWGFILQMAYLVDWYGMRGVCLELVRLWLPVNAALCAALAGAWYCGRRGWLSSFNKLAERHDRLAGIALTVVAAAAITLAATSGGEGPRYFNLFNFADLSGFARLVTWPLTALSLAGWIWAIFYHADRKMRLRRLVLALLLPGVCIGYVVTTYMYGARYFILYQTSFLVLGLFFACMLSGCVIPRWQSALPAVAAILIVLSQFFSRTQLFLNTDYDGLADFYADMVESNGLDESSLLLVEYPRIGTPLRYGFGIPGLGLDNEFTLNYSRALKNWRGIMSRLPEKNAYFLTPFNYKPRSRHFKFDQVWQGAYAGHRLADAHGACPDSVERWHLRPRLYRMRLRKSPLVLENQLEDPQTLTVGEGNMGMVDFGFCVRKSDVEVHAYPVPAEQYAHFRFDTDQFDFRECKGLLAIFLDSGETSVPNDKVFLRRADGAEVPLALFDLGGRWRCARIAKGDVQSPMAFKTAFGQALMLAQVLPLSSATSSPLSFESETEQVSAYLTDYTARWALRGARILPPAVAADYLLLFAVVPEELEGEVALNAGTDSTASSCMLSPGDWQWISVPLSKAEDGQSMAEIVINSDKALKLEYRENEYAMNLLLGRMVLWPR
ncbi:MAG: ArnT family glycosyltransferase [Verrucomicrobiota bacterium]